MSERDPPTVNPALPASSSEGEQAESTVKFYLTVHSEGTRRVRRKNYLRADELSALNRIATMFLDYAEDRASQRQNLRMSDWQQYVDRFVEFNERPLLTHTGTISHERMREIAHERYAAFDATRRQAEALAADAEDIRELEAVEKRGRKGGKDAS